ncbi:MAG: hypothetical protein D6707_01615, partial [Bacteroidetes bacterium]
MLKITANQIILENTPPFNRKFIKKNQIRQITGNVAVKKINDIIRETPLFESYEFNKEGLLVKVEKTDYLGKKTDTTIYLVQYSKEGKILEKTEWVGGAFLTKKFYYENNELKSMEYYRQSAKTANKIHLFSETFKTVKNTPVEKMIYCYNENNQHYKTITEQYDQYGNLIQRTEKFEVSGKAIVYT